MSSPKRRRKGKCRREVVTMAAIYRYLSRFLRGRFVAATTRENQGRSDGGYIAIHPPKIRPRKLFME